MEYLVFLLELIRPPECSGRHRDVNHVFCRIGFERISECVRTSARSPCSPIAIGLTLNLLGVKSINARKRTSWDVTEFAAWYIRMVNTLVHIDVSSARFPHLMGRYGPSVHSGAQNDFFVTRTRSRTKLSHADATGFDYPNGPFGISPSIVRRGEFDNQCETQSRETLCCNVFATCNSANSQAVLAPSTCRKFE